MDDLQCNDTRSNNDKDDDDDDCEESLYLSDDDDDPSRVSSLLLREIQTVARMMGMPEIETPMPEIESDLETEIETSTPDIEDLEPKMRAIELSTKEPEPKPDGCSSGGVLLLEEHENGKEIAPKDENLDINSENKNSKQTNPMIEKQPSSSSANNNHDDDDSSNNNNEPEQRTDLDHPGISMAQFMKELSYHAAMYRPVNLELETMDEESKKRKRNIMALIDDPEATTATKKRRERISENIRVLQSIIPGGGEMDIVSLIDETANYLRFLGKQVKAREGMNYRIRSNAFPPIFYFPN